MTVAEKRLATNRKNARKGGVKTPEGKAIVRYNALNQLERLQRLRPGATSLRLWKSMSM